MLVFLRKLYPINTVNVDPGELQGSLSVVSAKATVCEPMKTVAHNQQLDAPPSCLGGLKAVGVINLATKLADDPLNDVRSARHPWMVEVSEEKRQLVLKREDLLLQPTVLEGLPPLFPDPKPEVPLGLGFDIEQPRGQSLESFHSFTRSLVEVAEVVVKKLAHVTHTELQRDSREEFLAGTPKPPIPINDNSFKGITDFVSEALKHKLPVVRFLAGSEAGEGDVLSGGISAEQQGVVLAPNEDDLPIKQEVATPRGLKFLGHLEESFAALSQHIDPLKDAVGTDMQLTAHGSVGGFPVKVQMSGAQDETPGWGLFPTGLTESFLTVLAPPTSQPARPQPLGCADFDTVKAISLCG